MKYFILFYQHRSLLIMTMTMKNVKYFGVIEDFLLLKKKEGWEDGL